MQAFEEAIQPAGGNTEVGIEWGSVVPLMMSGGENEFGALEEGNETRRIFEMRPFMKLVGEKNTDDEKKQDGVKKSEPR